MFSFSLCASLAALVASAVAVSAAPSLSVKASTPNVNVDGLENLKVTTTIINTGNESLKLLNDPRGVNYSPTYAAGLDAPAFSPFSLLVLPLMSPMISPPHTTSLYLVPETTPSSHRAIIDAREFVMDAIRAIRAMRINNPPPRWTTWFGFPPDCDVPYVRNIFENMLEREIGLLPFDFICDQCDSPQVISYLFRKDTQLITLCPGFWNLPAKGPDSKAGTLIHEASHLNSIGPTYDHAVGQHDCKQLVAPNGFCLSCIWNADSYRYFAEDPDSWPNPHANPIANVDNPFIHEGNWSVS